MTTEPTLLILAGKRDGKLDPMAADAGVSHKCRVPICGKALLQWVLEAAIPAFPDTKVLISIHDPAVIADLAGVKELETQGRLMICQAQSGIVESVEYAAAQARDAAWPLMITTADNVLVTPELMRDVHAESVAGEGDAVIVLSTREAIHAAHPEGQRRFYEFADAAISNCNLFWLRDAKALKGCRGIPAGRAVYQDQRPHRQGIRDPQSRPLPPRLVETRHRLSRNVTPLRRSRRALHG